MDSIVNNILSSWDEPGAGAPTDKQQKRKSSSSMFSDFLKTDDATDHVDQKQAGTQLTDKLIERIISMALPPSSEIDQVYENIQGRIEDQKSRPSLSIQVMSRNFIAMNSRLSVPFQIIDEVSKIFSWTCPYYSLSILVTVSHMIINPITLIALPFLYIAFVIMVPAYMKHHPPEKVDECVSEFSNSQVPFKGEPLEKVAYPKPVPELSREFYLNLTDLQNRMLLYVVVYDFLNFWIVDFCYFKDEAVSGALFVAFAGVGLIVLLIFHSFTRLLSIIIKVLLLAGLWMLFFSLHPKNKQKLLARLYSEETRLKVLSWTTYMENRVHAQLVHKEENPLREVEVFELHRLDAETRNWISLGYCSESFPLNSVERKQGWSIGGKPSLQNVLPPKDWEFVSSDYLAEGSTPKNNPKLGWTLDLYPKEWVMQNNVEAVLEVDDDEKWCYDFDDGARGEFRRRRWIRACVRSFQKPPNDDKAEEKQKRFSFSSGVDPNKKV